MGVVNYTDDDIMEFKQKMVIDLWVNHGPGTPDIARIVRVSQDEAEEIIQEYSRRGFAGEKLDPPYGTAEDA